MKKIALVAPYNQYNYGTVLQAYALQRKVEEQGVAAEYLQYNGIMPPPRLLRPLIWACHLYKSFLPKKHVIASNNLDDFSFFRLPEFKPFADGYKRFISKRIKESNVCYNPVSLKKCCAYDAFMTGSDQTWGRMRFNKHLPYFLDGANDDYPKLSYAPSIGTTHIPKDYLEVLKEKLSRYQALSCRELTNCKLLSNVLNREVSYVIDPSLLLTADEWNSVAESVEEIGLRKKQYILCYILGEKQCISDFAEDLGRKKTLPVYYIVTRPMYLTKENHIFATPESFISMIRDADTVITDSFHGTIFSINYNTQFYSFTKRESSESDDNDRILEVLESFQLKERYQEGKYEFVHDIDWRGINSILSEQRIKSIAYLQKTLNLI